MSEWLGRQLSYHLIQVQSLDRVNRPYLVLVMDLCDYRVTIWNYGRTVGH